jgi:hypothetical protein
VSEKEGGEKMCIDVTWEEGTEVKGEKKQRKGLSVLLLITKNLLKLSH